MTHICVGKLTIIGSDNGLSPERRQTIIWTNDGILLIGPLGTNVSEIEIEIQTFSLKKILLKMSSAKWRPFVSTSMCQPVVTAVKGFILDLIEIHNEAHLPVYWDHTTAENSPHYNSYQLNSFLTSSFQNLSEKANSLAAVHLDDCFTDLGHKHTERGPAVWGLRENIAWPFKPNIEKPS